MAKIITVCSQKGGVGKTTLAANLSFALASTGRRVAIIDTDPQNSLSFCFGIDGETSQGFYDLVTGRVRLIDAIQDTHHAELKLMPAGYLRPGEQEPPAVDAATIIRLIDPLLRLADFVVFDTPAGLEGSVRDTLTASHAAVVPLQLEPLSAMTVPRVLEHLAGIKTIHGHPLWFLGLVLNEFSASRPSTAAVADEVFEQLPRDILFETTIPYHESIPRSVLAGVPLSRYESQRSVATESFRQLGHELLGRLEEFEAEQQTNGA